MYPHHPAQRPPPYPYRPVYATQTNGKAVAALILGLLSLMCFGVLTGLPALILGLLARRDIAKSGGTEGGSAMATTGIVTGALTTLGTAAVAVLMIFGAIGSSAKRAKPYVPPAPTAIAGGGIGTSGTTSRWFGTLEMRMLRSGSGPLSTQLSAEQSRASSRSKVLILFVTAPAKHCAACVEFERELSEPRLQSAFYGSVLARVDATEFSSDLSTLGFDRDALPHFFSYTPGHKPEDEIEISADAWDDNTWPNMAPPLRAFVSRARALAPTGSLGLPPTGPGGMPEDEDDADDEDGFE